MSTTYLSDTTVIDVNKALNDALRLYVDSAVEIRFDLPDLTNPPDSPVVSVFLYDISEGLEMRQGESRSYSSGVLLPGRVNVSCRYLITYWDNSNGASGGAPGGAPDNQAMLVMNQVLNALVNHRQLSSIPGAYTRVIPPKDDGLFSLGSFWQSLGNKPRLLLNYVVTVPLTLTAQETIPEVVDTRAKVEQLPPPIS